ncbi:MAG: inositol monophosphatase family protein [Nanoarchaeota archaeon]
MAGVDVVAGLDVVLRNALMNAYRAHERLGDRGLTLFKKKDEIGGDALLGDHECERAVIETCRQAVLPIRIVSEEHGLVDLCKHPRMLGVLDGIDGTSVYKNHCGRGRYGTMFAVYNGVYPTYDDYAACGVMEHASRRLHYAVRGQGMFETRLDPVGFPTRICIIHAVSGRKTLAEGARIRFDQPWPYNQKAFAPIVDEFKTEFVGSSAINYVDLANGTVDLVLECTRKGNLEIGVAYGMVKEAGGVMVDINGDPLGPQKFLSFGQEGHVGVISACSKELALEALHWVSR